METNKYILQKLKKSVNSEFERAEVYYSVLSLVNNLGLTEREIQLIAFTAIRGNITNANVRNEFCKKHNSSYNTIKNIVWKLKKYGIFTKQNNKIKINPVICLDFNKPLTLQINIIDGEANNNVD